MRDGEDIHALGDVLKTMADAGEDGSVTVQDIVAAIGTRSFGPLILAPSIIVVSPLSGIPGLPSICAAVVLLVAVQMLFGRDHVWLPGFLRRRSVERQRLRGALEWIRPLARRADRLVGPRLVFLTRGVFFYAIALACVAVALIMPPLEIVPLSNSISAATIAVLALALTARDGILAIVGFGLVGVSAWVAASLFFAAV